MRYSMFAAVAIMCVIALSGCIQPKNAIAVSNTSYNFGLNQQPFTMEVWNSNASAGTITVTANPTVSWISTVPAVLSCPPPTDKAEQRQQLKIYVDRTSLAAGTHEGAVLLKSSGIVTVSIQITAISTGVPTGEFAIVNPVTTYSEPYLIEFNFGLEYANGDAVVAEPGQFQITAKENDAAVGADNGLLLRRTAARQLKMHLVLDYSMNMQSIPNAIATMEDAATGILLPALNEDALVAVTEFHRDDMPPNLVTDFTVDRTVLEQDINAIQQDYVQGFASGSRIWDALVSAAESFDGTDASMEERYVLLFSDGNGISSVATLNEAGNALAGRGIHVFAIGFGPDANETDLEYLASRTEGDYLPAASIAALNNTVQWIVDNLGARYTLRWASLRRSDVQVFPSFIISLNTDAATYTAEDAFIAIEHAESPAQALEGQLHLVESVSNEGNATVYLRADYVPRYIRTMRLFVGSDFDFSVSIVSAVNDGLMAGWTIAVGNYSTAEGGRWIEVARPSSSAYIPFATFGPMLRFDFDDVGAAETIVRHIYIDNSRYTAGQSFTVDGFENTPPGS